MSGREICWRVGMLLQDMVDRVRIPLGAYPTVSGHQLSQNLDKAIRGFSFDIPEDGFSDDLYPQEWRDNLLSRANSIADHKLSYFNLNEQFLGNPINWHRDHNSGIDTQKGQIQNTDYRDFRNNGDCKHVWEPNRHHQFVILARAYRATGEKRYAETLADQFESWIDQNPFGYGMNWRSPLELGVRLINWVWSLELAWPSGCISGDLWQKVYQNAYLMCWDTQRKYSRGSSANNHLVGEAAGVFVASCYFGDFPERESWIKEAREILTEEIAAQSYSDGCTREHALSYQFFVIQLYLFCGLAGRWSGNEFPPRYWARLRSMIEFIRRVGEAGPLPLFGDQDDGYVLDLGNHARDVTALLDAASGVVELHLETASAAPTETAFWLFGPRKQNLTIPEPADTITSTRFEECGYYLLQNNENGSRFSVLFDCAELGYGAIAAHGHADALSIVVRAFDEYLLVDTGTYDYYTESVWRNYFRSTAAHNTIVIDGRNQSELLGRFLWGSRANSKLLSWEDNDRFTRVSGQHDGYRSLADPVTHQRTVTLEHKAQRCLIEDLLTLNDAHSVDVYFHLGPACTLVSKESNVCRIRVSSGHEFELALDSRLAVRTLRGSDDPAGGWYSAGYHQKVPITTIIGSVDLRATTTLEHTLQIRGIP